jgi:hypothetical protein
MKKAAILIILLQVIFCANCEAKRFYFHGTENNEYVNPANWSPSYPGTKIRQNDTVIVQSDVTFSGFNLEIEGEMEIVMGASFSAKYDGIIIREGGKLMNEGEMRTKFIDNDGIVDNSVAAAWISDSCINHKYGLINSLLASEMSIKRGMINEGKWNFSGKCVVMGEFVNEGEIALAHSANLEIKGNYYASSNSKVLKSIQSIFQTEKKVANTTTTNYSELMGNKAM